MFHDAKARHFQPVFGELIFQFRKSETVLCPQNIKDAAASFVCQRFEYQVHIDLISDNLVTCQYGHI